MEAEPAHVGACERDSHARSLETLPEETFLGGVAEPGDDLVRTLRTETHQVLADRLRAADRQDHNTLRVEIAVAPDRECLERDLITDSLDEDHRVRGSGAYQRAGSCLRRRLRTVGVPGEGSAGELIASRFIHSAQDDIAVGLITEGQTPVTSDLLLRPAASGAQTNTNAGPASSLCAVTLYDIEALAPLAAPVFITAFEGWVSAGAAGTTAADHLAGDARVVARFDTDELVDYRSNRPTIDIEDGVPGEVEWPDIVLRHQTLGGRDLLILTGPEPDRLWKQLSVEIGDLVAQLGIVEYLSLGGIPWAAAHTRPTALVMTASSPELIEEGSNLEGMIRVPAAAATVIAKQVMDQGIPTFGFFARVPHYVAGVYYPAVVALVDRVTTHLGVPLPAGSLVDEAADQRRRLDEAIEDQPQAKAIVKRLEEMADSEGDVSGAELAAEIERYLEQQAGDETFPDDIG